MEYSKQIDKKWQQKWKEQEIYKYNPQSKDKKLYIIEMFSYPSGAKLHLGHWFNYAPADSFARFKKMQGYNVFHPMGFDAFGLPAENYAIKTGIHPEDSTRKNIETMKQQLNEMGGSYDWDYTLETCMPDYYKWTQWIFTKLYEAGLAYKKEAPVNWCDSCKTVLANEQVISGKCERCNSEVKRKKLAQWFFKITDYAEQLLQDLDKLDWPESTKKVQTNWIGKSEGTEVVFKSEDNEFEIKVFTTRVDTLNGVTYVVVAPESELVKNITTKENEEAVEKYISDTSKLSEIERLSVDKEKTGVFTGAYVINPINGDKIPVWIADYVLEDYGTGSVMAVPAHDTRDYEFAKKYNLPIKEVVKTNNKEEELQLPFTDYGILINSGKYNGMTTQEAKEQITQDLKEKSQGEKTINYRLKDWLISRQRYWGAPIPIVYCDKCGTVVVPEKDLPVLLPYNVEFTPDGESPLKKSKEFINCTCPKCGGKATREADTLDTFVCSSWYELRYPDAKNEEQAFNKEIINKIAPVDIYVGGKEHAAMHLIYSRFMTKALRDLGYLSFDEPFMKLIHQGMVLGPDGNKMSKSKGNTVSPEEYIEKYGSDIFRMYIMFGFDYRQGGPWDEKGIESMTKYFSRIERLINTINELKDNSENNVTDKEKYLLRFKNQTIQAMTRDIDDFRFNTAIARSMELFNKINAYIKEKQINVKILKDTTKTFIKLLTPLAPHFAEEQWEKLGEKSFAYQENWPLVSENEIKGGTKDIPVQVNGKLKACVTVNEDMTPSEILEKIKNDPKVIEILEKNQIQKDIYIPGKIYNIVTVEK